MYAYQIWYGMKLITYIILTMYYILFEYHYLDKYYFVLSVIDITYKWWKTLYYFYMVIKLKAVFNV